MHNELVKSEWFGSPGNEPVRLVEHDPDWAIQALDWALRIQRAIGSIAESVEHIGSTAVPGLVAKPVLDLLVVVPNIADEPVYRHSLESLGLVLRQRETDHRFFRPPAGELRTVHVHVCEAGSLWEQEHLVFRDRLRADASLAGAYANLKRGLARSVGHDRLAYSAGKSQFIKDVVDGKWPRDLSV
ncbi:GrpB family protein [Glutamicibacter mishrai]|uniref:GrpB family protein n=1 Tax=Glutamicibacter mishrai TaxID=1775880 RepID=A0A6H0SN50_9MICC|nr:GrpB family protein [Glutamicibacter mishrai]QIV87859.1 GrpB family protein [Glutamicibacter mishrai]